jgi:putative flavoprotein involved in K+ transport
MSTEHVDTVVIGGGQAGLTTGYYLSKQRRSFVILDANARVGDAWRKRWASLRLFTPGFYNSLPGMRIPAPARSFPTKDEMADYLEEYAQRFDLPVRTGVTVEKLAKDNGKFVVSAGDDVRVEADNVVVATGFYRIPKIPPFASELDPRIKQLHSSEYVDPSQLQDGDVLVVGAGNSGAEIAYELAATCSCVLAGENSGQIPVRHGSLPSWPFFLLFRFVQHHLIRVDTRIGRKVSAKRAGKAEPLIRRREKDLIAVGVERAPRVVGVHDGRPLLEDGRVLDVANVVWCTGFRPDFSWIDLPVFAEDGKPRHCRGVVESEPGLYFVGLKFQYSASSDVLPSRGRDAAYVAKQIASRVPRGGEAVEGETALVAV